jgi:hypothetical protein
VPWSSIKSAAAENEAGIISIPFLGSFALSHVAA